MTRPRKADPVAVERAISGDPSPDLTTQERRLAVTELNRQGLDDVQIGRRIGVAKKTVARDRQALGLPAARHDAHAGLRIVTEFTGRDRGADPFMTGFFGDTFNRLVKDNAPLPCADRWDIYTETPVQTGRGSQRGALALRLARQLCATCPIRAACLERAMRPGPEGGPPAEVGIWAGTTEGERRSMWRRRKTAAQVGA